MEAELYPHSESLLLRLCVCVFWLSLSYLSCPLVSASPSKLPSTLSSNLWLCSPLLLGWVCCRHSSHSGRNPNTGGEQKHLEQKQIHVWKPTDKHNNVIFQMSVVKMLSFLCPLERLWRNLFGRHSEHFNRFSSSADPCSCSTTNRRSIRSHRNAPGIPV